MSREIDYAEVVIPNDEPPENYDYTQRRADILTRIRAVGHPSAINQSSLADRFGCSQPTISNDFDVLAEYIDEHRGDRRTLDMDAVRHRVLRGLLAEGSGEDADWRALKEAWKVARDWDDYLRERADVEDLRGRLDNLEELIEAQSTATTRDRSQEIAWREEYGD